MDEISFKYAYTETKDKGKYARQFFITSSLCYDQKNSWETFGKLSINYFKHSLTKSIQIGDDPLSKN